MDSNNHAPEENDFATVEEVQKRCRVTRKTVEAWIESGELPHYRLGPRTIRIAVADLEQFLEARRFAGLPPNLRTSAEAVPDARNSHGIPENIRSKHSAPAESDSRTAAA
jgi:excisionase family DNA binding protein